MKIISHTAIDEALENLDPELSNEISIMIEKITVLKTDLNGASTGIPLAKSQGIVIFASDLDGPPLVVCMPIPIPRDIDTATSMRNRWTAISPKAKPLWVMSQTILEECGSGDYKGDARNMAIKIGCFMIDYLQRNGISLQEQMSEIHRLEKLGNVIAYVVIQSSHTQCILCITDAGPRLDPEADL